MWAGGAEGERAGDPGKSVTDSAGQAAVDSIKAPLDKARQVEGTLEKAAGKTADAVKDATP